MIAPRSSTVAALPAPPAVCNAASACSMFFDAHDAHVAGSAPSGLDLLLGHEHGLHPVRARGDRLLLDAADLADVPSGAIVPVTATCRPPVRTPGVRSSMIASVKREPGRRTADQLRVDLHVDRELIGDELLRGDRRGRSCPMVDPLAARRNADPSTYLPRRPRVVRVDAVAVVGDRHVVAGPVRLDQLADLAVASATSVPSTRAPGRRSRACRAPATSRHTSTTRICAGSAWTV